MISTEFDILQVMGPVPPLHLNKNFFELQPQVGNGMGKPQGIPSHTPTCTLTLPIPINWVWVFAGYCSHGCGLHTRLGYTP